MKRLVFAAMAALMVTGLAAPAWAQGVDSMAVITIHLKDHNGPVGQSPPANCVDSPVLEAPPLNCTGYNVTGSLDTPYDLYIVVANRDSIFYTGASFGVDYNPTKGSSGGVDFFGSWVGCADLENPIPGDNGAWPNPDSGNTLTWSTENCQGTEIGEDQVHTTLGALYVYAYTPDEFSITINRHKFNDLGELAVGDCDGRTTDLKPLADQGILAVARFGMGAGHNPCLDVPVLPTSWGQIKNLYKN